MVRLVPALMIWASASAEVIGDCGHEVCGLEQEEQALLQLAPGRHRSQVLSPTAPKLCEADREGECECATEENMQTYTYIDGYGVQQCFTTYTPETAVKPMPVALYSQCYGKTKLRSFSGGLRKKWQRFGVALVYLSSLKGGWTLAHNNVVNDTIPMPCDSPDLDYVGAVLDFIAAKPEVYDAAKVAPFGYSQNGQFSAYIGTCFAERIWGMWQGMAGLSINGRLNPRIPPRAPECSLSSNKEHGRNCAEEEPCRECQYFPIYPCHLTSAHQTIHCQQGYTNDGMVSGEPKDEASEATAGHYLFEVSAEGEGNPVRMLMFRQDEDNGIRGGHAAPKNDADWIVGCLGLKPPCAPACEASVSACFEEASGQSWRRYEGCVEAADAALCAPGCAPTKGMLDLSERPISKLTGWGAVEERPRPDRPSSSKCENPASGGGPTTASPSTPAATTGASPSTPAATTSASPSSPAATTGASPSTPAATTSASPSSPAATTSAIPSTTPGPGVCSEACSDEFVDKCVPFWTRKQSKIDVTPYQKCRGELDAMRGRISRPQFGCVSGCRDTEAMAATAT